MYSKIAILLTCLALTRAALVPTGYNFGYDIQGPGDGQSRQETGDANGNVAGSYSIRDIDGRQRKVNYVADALGFRANIDTNEPGTAAKSPANVLVNGAVDALPVVQTGILGVASAGLSGEYAPTISSEYRVPTAYKFGYDIQGPLDGQGREESGDGNGNVAGSYSLRDADGRQRRVNYVADALGFRANIDTNEPGTAAKSPADVQLNSPYLPPLPVEPLPVAAPIAAAPLAISSPISQVALSSPLSYETPQLISSPLPIVQKHLTAPLITAPAPLYTSRIHSSTSYAAPVLQQELPLISAPAPIISAPAPLYTSRTHSSTSYAAPTVLQQELPLISAPAPLISAPLYTSRTHSSTSYAKVAAAPIFQQELPLISAPAPIISAPAPIISAPLYTSRTHSSTSYAAPVIQQVLPTLVQKPILQAALPLKTLLPVQQGFGYKSTVHSSTSYAPVAAPLPVIAPVQQYIAPQALPVALPTYTSSIHSSTGFGGKVVSSLSPFVAKPIVQEKLLAEQLKI